MKRDRITIAALIAAVVLLPASTSGAQSVLERSPNLSGGWVGPPGVLHFNFLHRFNVSDPPVRKVSNTPTFLLAYRLPFPTLLGVHYSTDSDVAGVPNEWEFFARHAALEQGRRVPLDLAVQVGFNEAAESIDGELSLASSFGPVRVTGVARGLSDGYGSGETRWALGGGAAVRLHRFIAVSGDVASLLDRADGEEVAWGGALQLAIPYTPHTLSLQLSNTSTATLQGASRGIDNVRFGFEFTIPVTLSRYFGGSPGVPAADDAAAAEAPAAPRGPAAEDAIGVEMRDLAFRPARIEVAAGTTVEWTNEDPVVHTVTAEDGSWDSGAIEPGETWRRTFDEPGTYRFHCTPHPFMTGVVVVTGGAP